MRIQVSIVINTVDILAYHRCSGYASDISKQYFIERIRAFKLVFLQHGHFQRQGHFHRPSEICTLRY